MPNMKMPDGRVIPLPDNYTQEDVDKALAGEAQPPPMLAAPAGPPPMDAPPAPIQELPADQSWASQIDADNAPAANLARHRQEDADSMPWLQQAFIGGGQAIDESMRGVNQLGTYLLKGGESPEYKKLLEDEEESRKIDDAILSTGGGRTGQVVSNLVQAIAPGAGAAKVLSIGGKTIPLAKMVAAQMGTSAIGGATRPVVEGESRGANAAVSGVLGGVGTAPLPVAKALLHTVPTKIASMIRGSLGNAGQVVESAAQKKARGRVGPMIEALTGSYTIPAKTLASKVSTFRLPNEIADDVAVLQHRARSQYRSNVTGREAQKLREDIGAVERTLAARSAAGNATTREALQIKALQELRRNLDKGVEAGIGKKKAKALRNLHDHYREGTRPPDLLDNILSGVGPAAANNEAVKDFVNL